MNTKSSILTKSKPLTPIEVGDSIRFEQDDKTWKSATVLSKVDDRLYVINAPNGDKLSEGKRATQSTTAPCYPPCGADKAVDGDRNTCMKDTAIGKRSPEKSVWWTVDLGGNHSIYSISIDFKDYGVYENRQRSRFAGFSIYISNTPSREGSSLCYKNTLPLPPLVFNTTCIGYGRYVIYYNERLDGVTYPEEYEILAAITELCEVKVQGCSKVGVYGSNCSTPCPINCQDGSCNIVNGSCLGCAPGYIGQNCKDECVWGRHGTDCKRHCSGHCKGNISCNHVTGICDGGCAAGWMGKQCDQHCLKGFFGQKCEEHCSTNCINRICDHITGACVKGCLKGYTGMRCSNCKKIKR
ncbi:multiple epidermal growth factor-like domains protein 10 [Saccostrea echinata]|uniref:multiple epidermal growth factor-like domains protein 10 n=1 Tax=Saccostrea echinata TaxID=191078 RepID=UPI002A803760|nr:multiple epidermal growth factor-like domains protein 10 [Saccostrea echinata]